MVEILYRDKILQLENPPGWEFWERNDFEPEMLQLIAEYDPLSFFDIGAWIGPASIWAALGRAEVYALEPDPVAYKILSQNISKNKLDIVAVNAALVTNLEDDYVFWSDGGNSESSSYKEFGEPISVNKTLYPSFKFDLVKMDVEGAELDLVPFYIDKLIKQPLILSLHQPMWNKPPFKFFEALEKFRVVEVLSNPGPWQVVWCR